MICIKKRAQKALEYEEKYLGIPRDFKERLSWMYDQLHITPNKQQDIIMKRLQMIDSLYYRSFQIVLYEEPEGSPRPRFRLVNRRNAANMSLANSNFVQVYSPTGYDDNRYMRLLLTQEQVNDYNNLLATPCDIRIRTYHRTPSVYNATDKILAEIGLHRPIAKPDWDNIEKKYSDMFNHNIWLDDIMVLDGSISKYYSCLPRVEIDLYYLNMVYNKHQYNQIIKRADYQDSIGLQYFNNK